MNKKKDWPRKPIIYEVNTRIWLAELSHRLGRQITLFDVPDDEIVRWKGMGYHAVWLMGIWQTSKYSRDLCRASEGLKQEARTLLGYLTESDLGASPYAVAGYQVDEPLGGDEALAAFRKRLAAHQILLVLDFVPNHLAADHPWVKEYPERFIEGSPERTADNPDAFLLPEHTDRHIAHGRDPHFPPWTDTAQLNYFNLEVHQAMQNELMGIAGKCDGVRCDMAMLLLPKVFGSVWEWASHGEEKPPCFWNKTISMVKNVHPDFLFLAEVYWGLEGLLQERGFDYTYDKNLYDHLVSKRTAEIHSHLATRGGFHERTLRFIENHDEPRAASVFGPVQARMAAALTLTLPGATLIHQGQECGRRKKLPVQLRRSPLEPGDEDLERFYRQLIQTMRSSMVQDGKWEMLTAETDRGQDILAYQWSSPHDGASLVFMANLTAKSQEGCLKALCPSLQMGSITVEEITIGKTERRQGLICTRAEIPFKLAPWGFNLVKLSR